MPKLATDRLNDHSLVARQPKPQSLSGIAVDTMTQVLNAIPEPTYIKDRRHRWIVVNDAFCEYLSTTREALLGKTDAEFLGARETNLARENDDLVFSTGQTLVVTSDYVRADRSRNGQHEIRKTLIRDSEGQELIVGVIREAHRRDFTRAVIENLAGMREYDSDKVKPLRANLGNDALAFDERSDPLTLLPNRRSIVKHLDRYLESDDRVAVFIVNVDHFKLINDRYSHVGGDVVLREIADRIQGALGDSELVARLGGDEFIFVVHDLDVREAEALAHSVLSEIAQPYWLGNDELRLSASIGIAVTPQHGRGGNELIRNAGMATGWCKRRSRGGVEIYSDGSSSAADRQAAIELKLPIALENHELATLYQPIVRSNDRMVIGFEALSRWHDPDLGELKPDEFVPIAEEMGLIRLLGREILEQACKFLSTLSHPKMTVSVNVSGYQLIDQTFPIFIAETLQKYNASGEQLILEMTETVAMEAEAAVWSVLEQLASIGIRLVIDDFGTGFSNLSRLKQLPFVAIKIDREFVRDLPDSPQDSAIFRAIHAIAKELNLKVVAEGIETVRQEEMARRLGVDFLQGYRFGHPMPVSKLTRYTATD